MSRTVINALITASLVALLCGCGLTQSATDSTASTARSIFYKQVKTLHLDLSSRVAMNTDESNMNGLAVPTLVRVYQLRNDKTWAKTSYESLLGDDDNLLRSDLLDRRAVVVKPGEGTQLACRWIKTRSSSRWSPYFANPTPNWIPGA